MEEEVIKVKHKHVGKVMFPMGIVLLIVHAIGVMNNWYNLIPWFDIPLHFLWGAVGALFFYWVAYRFPGYVDLDRNFFVTLVIVLSWTALGGVIWEFSEFLYDLLVYVYGFSLGVVQFSLDDTLADLAFDLFGGLAVVVTMYLVYHKNNKRS